MPSEDEITLLRGIFKQIDGKIDFDYNKLARDIGSPTGKAAYLRVYRYKIKLSKLPGADKVTTDTTSKKTANERKRKSMDDLREVVVDLTVGGEAKKRKLPARRARVTSFKEITPESEEDEALSDGGRRSAGQSVRDEDALDWGLSNRE